MPGRTWKRWTASDAAEVLRDLDESGLSLAAFARERGLCEQRIRRWRDRLVPSALRAAPRLVELVAAAPRAATAAPAPVALRLHCPTGHVLEVEHADLASGVLAILRALTEAGC